MRDEDTLTVSPTEASVRTIERPAVEMTDGELAVASGSVRYRLGSMIGKGGMGEIIAATDAQIGREVAVKRMKAQHPSDRAMSRFFREACIQGRLDHPAIVPVHELGVDEQGRPFFAMKKLAGTTLAQRIKEGHPRQRLLRAFADVCLAIEFAHRPGVIHRDIKPHNIVLGDYGEVYVLDWGVAKLVAEGDVDPALAGDDSNEQVTVEGTVIGTPGYMAPEQARAAKDIDGRADIYALGCVLYEILTGEAMHPAGTAGIESVLAGRYSRPSTRADVAPELDELCRAATAKEPAERVQTARELGEAVQRYLDGDRDLELRRQLASERLDVARAAFTAGDAEDQRRVAMREAGRALALDPANAGAGELVSRLMLEPPRVTPPEVTRRIEADAVETLRRQSRAAVFGYMGFISFLPAIIAGGVVNLAYGAILGAIIGLNCFLLLYKPAYRNLRLRSATIIFGNAVLIAFVARATSPVLIAPGLAAIVAMAVILGPVYARLAAALAIAGVLAVAVFVPWLLEAAGLLSTTVTMTADQIVLTPLALQLATTAKVVAIAFYVVALISAAAGMAHENRKADRVIRHRLHMQAWQLRQLVPDATV